MRTFTARELEQETGFSRRTIAYYVHVGLLPRVGRRGPKTRYPKLVRDRLLFIQRVREAEAEGKVPATPLRQIGAVFEGLSQELIACVAEGRMAVSADILSGSPAPDAPRTRPAVPEDSLMVREGETDGPRGAAPLSADEPELAALLAALRRVAGRGDVSPGALEAWVRIEIAPGILLSVRGVSDEDAALLEAVGSRLRARLLDGA